MPVGLIGGHLTGILIERGFKVRAVDIKPISQWFQRFHEAENLVLDLKNKEACRIALQDCEKVFNLAADMGGMGFIVNNKALCMLSVLINTHLLQVSVELGIERFFFASSACVYAEEKQTSVMSTL